MNSKTDEFMKYIKTILIIGLVLFCVSCAEDVADNTIKGEAITGLGLISPDNNDTLILNIGNLEEEVVIMWNEAKSGLGSPIKYKFLLDEEDGDFSEPLAELLADNNGSVNKLTLSHGNIKSLLDQLGVTEKITVRWTIQADNDSGNLKNAPYYIITFKIGTVGLSKLNLLNPIDNVILSVDKSATPDEELVFSWDPVTATNGGIVNYLVIMDKKGNDFATPFLKLTNVNDTSATITYSEFVDTLDNYGITEKEFLVEWKVKAYVEDFATESEVRNALFQVKRIGTLFITGSATEVDWNIDNAIQLQFVEPNMWLGFIKLKSGEFKFFPVQGSWDNGLGSGEVEGQLYSPGGNITSPVEGDDFKLMRIQVTLDEETGIYTYIVIPAEMLLVGDATPAGWDINNGYNMLYRGSGQWITYADMTSGGWKFFYQTGNWDTGYKEYDPVNFPGQLDLEPGGANIESPGDGYFRIIINTFELTYITESVEKNMYIVGDATPNGWDVGNATPMIWDEENKEWTVEVDLIGGKQMKFVPATNWDYAFGLVDGELSADPGGGNIPGPDTDGTYIVKFSFGAKNYSITPK